MNRIGAILTKIEKRSGFFSKMFIIRKKDPFGKTYAETGLKC